jgi:hypothetical protein
MKYIVALLAGLFLSGCFHRAEPTSTPDGQPTSDSTDTWSVVETGSVVATGATGETGTVDASGAAQTGFNTKDFSDPEVEEVVDLLEELIEK